VFNKIMRAVAEKKRVKRKSTLSKLKAAVKLNGIMGSIKAFTAFRRLERENGGTASANCSFKEAREGTNIIWESCQADLTIYATRDGHALYVRNTLEIKLLLYLQSDLSKAPSRTADGKERARPVSVFEHRTPAPKMEEKYCGEGGLQPPNEGLPGPDPYPGNGQDRGQVHLGRAQYQQDEPDGGDAAHHFSGARRDALLSDCVSRRCGSAQSSCTLAKTARRWCRRT
jgi:hypothetical protein